MDALHSCSAKDFMAIHNITLQVIFFKEAAKVIAYAPALDLSACGDNLEDAKKGFDTVVKAFFEELMKMGTLEKVLHTLGWRKKVQTWAVTQQRNTIASVNGWIIKKSFI